jgi:aminoglycoside phosphotransferase
MNVMSRNQIINRERFSLDADMLMERIFHELDLRVEKVQPLGYEDLGDNSEVYTALHNSEQVIIKLDTGRGLANEQVAVSVLEKHDIPCPSVLGFLPEDDGQKSVIVETAISGVKLSRIKEEVADLYEATGKVLKDIHNIKLQGFGSLEVGEHGVQGQLATWKENVEMYKTNFNLLEQKGFISKVERQKLEWAHEITANTPLPEASFVHGDFQPPHMFFEDRKLTGIIDLANCYAGDPHRDIANMQYFLGPKELEAFNHGYGHMATDELTSIYGLLVTARKLIYRIDMGFTNRIPSALAALAKHFAILGM